MLVELKISIKPNRRCTHPFRLPPLRVQCHEGTSHPIQCQSISNELRSYFLESSFQYIGSMHCPTTSAVTVQQLQIIILVPTTAEFVDILQSASAALQRTARVYQISGSCHKLIAVPSVVHPQTNHVAFPDMEREVRYSLLDICRVSGYTPMGSIRVAMGR
jgi:hypothetical protein